MAQHYSLEKKLEEKKMKGSYIGFNILSPVRVYIIDILLKLQTETAIGY